MAGEAPTPKQPPLRARRKTKRAEEYEQLPDECDVGQRASQRSAGNLLALPHCCRTTKCNIKSALHVQGSQQKHQQGSWLQSAARQRPPLGPGLQQDAHACSSQAAGQEAQQAAGSQVAQQAAGTSWAAVGAPQAAEQAAGVSRAAVGVPQAAQQAAGTSRAAVGGPQAAWHLQDTSSDLQGMQATAAAAAALNSMEGNVDGSEGAPEQQLPPIRRR